MHHRTPIALLTALTASAAALAGPITPPAGPVAPTGKTLTQIEPRIPVTAETVPGSSTSVFTINQAGSYYLTGNISVPSGKSGVVIVSPGVTLDLNGFTISGTAGSVDGVQIFLGCQRVVVRNGTIKSCAGSGVNADAEFTDGGAIENVIVMGCTGTGIAAGRRASVRHCQAHGNTGDGIVARYASRVSECTSSNNGGKGFDLDSVSTAEGCTAVLNSAWGIRAADDVRIERCHLNANGIAGESGGILAGNFCAVRNNTIDFHLGSLVAIKLTGHQNTVEGNAVSRAAVGVDVDGSANTVLRNTFTGTATPADIPGGNAYGPFVNVSGVGNIASVAGSSHPWANLVQ